MCMVSHLCMCATLLSENALLLRLTWLALLSDRVLCARMC